MQPRPHHTHTSPTAPPLPAEVLRALEQQAWRHFLARRLDDAEELAMRILTFDHEHAWASYLLGEIAGKRHHPDAALEHYRRAISLGRQDAETLLRASESAMKLRLVQEAVSLMSAALRRPELDHARRRSIEAFLQNVRRRSTR